KRHTRSTLDWSSEVCSSYLYTLSARLGNPPPDSAPNPPLADRTNFGNKSARAAPSPAAAALTSVCASRRSGLCSSKLEGMSLGRSEERRVGREGGMGRGRSD